MTDSPLSTLAAPDLAARLQADSALHDSAHAAALIALLADAAQPTEARWRAAVILGAIAARDAVPALIAALADPSWDVRHSAAWALGHMGDPRGFAPLHGIVTSSIKDEQIPYVAAMGLTQIDRERGLTALREAAHHPADAVLSIARSALTGLEYR